MAKITDLLHDSQDLFLMNLTEMKGISGDLGEMRIPLKSDWKPVKKRPYRFNPLYKDA